MTRTADVMSEADLARHTLPADESGLGCLGTERGNLPLESIDVRSEVTGLAVHTVLAQGFRNTYAEPLEATYIFPLPDRAAVTALRMTAADRVVEGILKEREQARADYDQAIAEGRRASIAEEERPGVFTLRVGNIMPGELVTIQTSLTGRLPFEDGEATYRFPLVVAPRFVPGTALPGGQVGDGVAADTDRVPDASRISPPVLLPGFPNPVRLGIRVAVDPAGLGLRAVRSSLHGVDVAPAATTDQGPAAGDADTGTDATGSEAVVVTLAHPGERANRDFILRLRYGAEDAVATSLAVQPDPDSAEEGTFLLTLLPPAGAESQDTSGTDLVVVLDRSGSMEGWKMVAARRAAARIVDTLTDRDRFQVLAFDDQVETPPALGEGLVAATDRHRFRAVEHLATIDARGGTWFKEALDRAVALLGADADGGPRRAKALILVTDGQVGNEDEILAELGPALGAVRVHTLGVDRAVNEAFLRRLAQNSGGRYELVESEDRLDEAMAAIHRRIAGPVLTGLRLSAAGLDVDADSVEPARLPDLFPGAPVVVSGRYRGKADGAVTVSGVPAGSQGAAASPAADAATADGPAVSRGGAAAPWSATVAATTAATSGLAAYWARGRVRDLEDRYLVAGADPALEREILATSLRFSVLCRFTAFVAVDSRVVNRQGWTRRVTNPVDAPDGWDMLDVEARDSLSGVTLELFADRDALAQPAAFPAPAPRALPAPAAPPMVSMPPMGGFGSAPPRPGGAPGAMRGFAGPAAASAAPTAGGPRPVESAKRRSAGGGGKRAKEAVTYDLAAEPFEGAIGAGGMSQSGTQAQLILAGLRAMAGQDADARAAELTRLAGVTLPMLLRQLAAEGADEAAIDRLAELIARLGAPLPEPADPAELEDRWALALAVLESVAGDPGDAGHRTPAPETRSRKPFWKR